MAASSDDALKHWADKFIGRQLAVPGRVWDVPADCAQKLYPCQIVGYKRKSSCGIIFEFEEQGNEDRTYEVSTHILRSVRHVVL